MALLTFLSLNFKWLLIDPDELYDIALFVSRSNPKEKDEVMDELVRILRKNLVDSEH